MMIKWWQEKYGILQNLCRCELVMREPGDWYVNQHVNVVNRNGNVVHTIGVFGEGGSPSDAVNNHFDILTKVVWPDYVAYDEDGTVTADGSMLRRRVRWDGTWFRAIPLNEHPKKDLTMV